MGRQCFRGLFDSLVVDVSACLPLCPRRRHVPIDFMAFYDTIALEFIAD